MSLMRWKQNLHTYRSSNEGEAKCLFSSLTFWNIQQQFHCRGPQGPSKIPAVWQLVCTKAHINQRKIGSCFISSWGLLSKSSSKTFTYVLLMTCIFLNLYSQSKQLKQKTQFDDPWIKRDFWFERCWEHSCKHTTQKYDRPYHLFLRHFNAKMLQIISLNKITTQENMGYYSRNNVHNEYK